MKLSLGAIVLPLALLAAAPAFADDAVATYSIASVVERPDFATETSGVRFFFGNAPHPAVSRSIEANATTSLRTRKLGRSSEEACQWVLMSALVQLRNHATSLGGNAVINVRSNWRNQEFSSATEYQCAAGFLMAGVALKGDVVSLR
jgi:uncharacterized protein YbjQ (UPF0145 family)